MTKTTFPDPDDDGFEIITPAVRAFAVPHHTDPTDPAELGIVEQRDHAVAGEVEVGFDPISAFAECLIKRRQRVFRLLGGGSAVGDDEHP